MSRNGSGVYTFPSSSGEFKSAVSGTTLTAASWNTLAADIETAVTGSLASNGETTATARIPFAAGISGFLGTTALTSFSATGAANTGIYFPTNAKIGFSISGTEQVRLEDGIFEPVTNNDVDLGTTALKFKDGFFAGTITAGTVTPTTLTGYVIGTDVQAYDAQLADIAALAVTDGNIIVGDGANWVAESGATARTSLGLAIGTDVQAYNANTIFSNVATSFTAAQGFLETTLTDAATIAWDASANQVAKVTLAGNRTLGAPTNQVAGKTYILRVIQDATGSRTLAYNAVFKFPSGTAPTLSTAANSIDILTFVSDGTNMYGVSQLGFA